MTTSSPAPTASASPPPAQGATADVGRAWLIVGLLACAQAINQADKAVLGLAAEPIMRELSLTPAQFGWVAGSLFAFFALGGIAVAFLAAPRFPPRILLMAMLLIWSLSQLPIVFAASLSVLVACRMTLGAGEGAAAPTAMNACHEWFPNDRRALPSAIIMTGGTIGQLISAPLLTLAIIHYGWRSAFLACSIAGFVLLAAWVRLSRDGPYAARPALNTSSGGDLSMLRRLLADPTVAGNLIVGFCGYWIVGFAFAWLAAYLRSRLGFEMAQSGWMLSLIYLSHGFLILFTAAFSQRLLAWRFSSRIARTWLMAGCLLGSGLCFAGAIFVQDPTLHLILIGLATGLPGGIFPLSSAMISEVAPPQERYRLMTIVLSSVTVSALLAPIAAGSVIDLDRPDGWHSALATLAAIGLGGGLAALALLHPARTIARFGTSASPAVAADQASGRGG